MRKLMFVFVMLFHLQQALASPPDKATFTPARRERKLLFPQDHGSHEDYRTEWWYYTGHLWLDGAASFATTFGFQLTFFRSAVVPSVPSVNGSPFRQLYFAHAAVTDVEAERFVSAKRYSRGGVGAAEASSHGLSVRNNDWSVSTSEGVHKLRFSIEEPVPYEVILSAAPKDEVLLHGEDGFSQKGECETCASHYYSFPYLELSGTVRKEGATHSVQGVAWMDHEFMSSALEEYQVGWDWLSLIFRDERRLMVARVRSRSGDRDFLFGTLVTKEGKVLRLERNQIKITELDHWESPETGAKYPVSVKVVVSDYGVNETVVPLLLQQEQSAASDESGAYWEGAVKTGDGDALGYLELTGYEKDFKAKL